MQSKIIPIILKYLLKKVINFRLGICITVGNIVIFKIWLKFWARYIVIGDAGLILYLDTKLPDPFYANFFIMLLTAINSKQEVGDQPGKYLDH